MKKYRCIRALVLDSCDDDSGLVENERTEVAIGDIYECDEQHQEPLLAAAKPAVHLERNHGDVRSWIEVYPDTLVKHFEEIR